MKTNWRQLSIELHNQIRAGQSAEAALSLQKLNSSQVPREMALEFASLCRRAGIFSQALRILRPVVLNEHSNGHATPSEIGEYGISLFKSGCVFEALRWLDSIKDRDVGEADLYRGFAHMMEWDYKQAIGPLRNFIARSPDSFIKLVAKVNLSASLINTGELLEAEQLIRSNMNEAEKFNNLRLKANSLELLSQIAIKNKEYKKASAFLDKAWQILEADKSSDQLFVIKWKSILEGIESGNAEKLNLAREAARKQNHFETIRDLDFYELKIKYSDEVYNKLYCGTPFSTLR